MLYCLCTFQDMSISDIKVSLGVAMALHEERNEQKQRKWLSRLARERRDLSASVEATLLDTALQEQRGQGEVDEQESSIHSAQGATLIPPRLSLQSRMMTAIQPGSFVEDAVRAHTTETSAIADEAETTSSSVAAQNSSMLARFAQRITTSLAAFGTAMHPEVFPPSFVDNQDEQQKRPEEESLVVSRQIPTVSVPEQMTMVPESTQQWGETVSGSTGSSPSMGVPPVTTPPGQSRQRLAGRTGKIRLETAVLPVPQFFEQKEETQQSGKGSGATSADLMAVDTSGTQINATSAHLPAMSKKLGGAGGVSGTTSAHFPTFDKYRGEVGAAARGALSGSGVIECGQQEVIVANKHVSTSSVVLVMLTRDPGPVVVQYISLQPQVGFTIHLTAPAAMKASFNYVVLLGELF